MKGKKVCYMHGGKTPSGVASPHFKTGRYSKGNANLVARYNDALANPTILSLKEDIATIDTRLNVLWEQIEGSGTQSAWVNLDKQYKQFVKAFKQGDNEKSTEAITEIGRLIQEGSKDTKLWEEFTNLQDHRRKMFESQSRHYEREKNYVHAEVLMLVFGAVLDLIVKNVTDRDTLTKLQSGIDNILKSTVVDA